MFFVSSAEKKKSRRSAESFNSSALPISEIDAATDGKANACNNQQSCLNGHELS